MTLAEHELWSTITHWVGAVVFAFYGTFLIKNAPKENKFSIKIFVVCSLIVLFASGLYHIMPQGIFKRPFQILDHSAIFLLMGATYQVCYDLVFNEIVSKKIKKICFISFWILIAILIISKIAFWNSITQSISLGLYLFGAWIAIFSTVSFLRYANIKTLIPILLGIILYGIGALIDYKEWGTNNVDAHVIFHVFVLVALFTHYEFVRQSIKNISSELVNKVEEMANTITEIVNEIGESLILNTEDTTNKS